MGPPPVTARLSGRLRRQWQATSPDRAPVRSGDSPDFIVSGYRAAPVRLPAPAVWPGRSPPPTRYARTGSREWLARPPLDRGAANNGGSWAPAAAPRTEGRIPPEGVVRGRTPGKPSNQTFSPKALTAIAEASRRSREAGVGPDPLRRRPEGPSPYGTTDGTIGAPVPPAAHAVAAGSTAVAERSARLPRRPARPLDSGERRLRMAIGIAAGVLVATAAAVVGTANDGHPQTGGRTVAARSHRPASSTVPRAGTSSGHAGASSTSSTLATTGGADGQATANVGSQGPASTVPNAPAGTTSGEAGTSSTLAPPDGPPALSALAPPSGPAGQAVTVTGSNFLSPSGQISARVGGEVASVTCPDQTTCTVVIPPNQGATSSAPVTISTDSGTSNALAFTYGSLAPAVTPTARRSSPGLVLYGGWRQSRPTGTRCSRCRGG